MRFCAVLDRGCMKILVESFPVSVFLLLTYERILWLSSELWLFNIMLKFLYVEMLGDRKKNQFQSYNLDVMINPRDFNEVLLHILKNQNLEVWSLESPLHLSTAVSICSVFVNAVHYWQGSESNGWKCFASRTVNVHLHVFYRSAKAMKNPAQLNPGISYTISTVSNCMCHFSPTFAHWNNLSFHPTKIENNEAGLLCRGLWNYIPRSPRNRARVSINESQAALLSTGPCWWHH